MTLDNEKIVELLQIKSDLNKARIEEYLKQLAEKVNGLSEGEEIILEEVGHFFVEDGLLHFEPDNKLATEINYKYAGMQPLEIVGANKAGASAADADQEEPEEVTDREVQEEKAKAEELIEELTTDIPEKLDEEEKESGEEPSAEQPAPTPDEDREEEPGRDSERRKEPEEETLEPVAERAGQTSSDSSEKTSRETSQNDTKGSESGTTRKRKVFNAQDRAQKDSIFSLVNTLVAIIIIVGVGYLVYRFDDIKERRNQRNTAQVTQQQAEQQSGKSDAANKDDENKGGNNETGNQPGQQPAPSDSDLTSMNKSPELEKESTEEPPKYGLRGKLPETALEGYTIVVHSLKSKAAAYTRKNFLINKNYRAIVMGVELAGKDTTWRVGIGQFETVEDALQATKSLKAPYKENHFIKRIIQ